jgi:hypothetical protein
MKTTPIIAPSVSAARLAMAAMENPAELDCYPYTFSPLLLFAEDGYFDKGHSNYNSVAQFFSPVLQVDMLHNVLYERKNMLYEELLEMVSSQCMTVTCCIESHFTAFQVLSNNSLIYYDPLSSALSFVSGDAFKKFVSFMLLKCNYGNSQHIQEKKDYYIGKDSNSTRRMIYGLWKDINKMDRAHVRVSTVSLNLDEYLLINGPHNPRSMSTQLTGNTCYFQTYLFCVLCRVCTPSLSRDRVSVDLSNVEQLREVSSPP